MSRMVLLFNFKPLYETEPIIVSGNIQSYNLTHNKKPGISHGVCKIIRPDIVGTYNTYALLVEMKLPFFPNNCWFIYR